MSSGEAIEQTNNLTVTFACCFLYGRGTSTEPTSWCAELLPSRVSLPVLGTDAVFSPMGGPNLEVFKFALYVFFPVMAFMHYGDPDWYTRNVLPVRILSPCRERTSLDMPALPVQGQIIPARRACSAFSAGQPGAGAPTARADQSGEGSA